MHLKSEMKMEVQEALWYFLKGRNGYIKLKFGKYNNYSLHIHATKGSL